MKSLRNWSNLELKKFSGHFKGEIINVSGWLDEDKEGGIYRDYFYNSNKYYVSNYSNDKVRGISEKNKTDFIIDLGSKLNPELKNRFDVVFNHTVLEHVSDPFFVFSNLSSMTKDILISIVPFKQKLHFAEDSYGDFFRFSPMAMRKLYHDNNFKILYESYSPPPFIDIYLFYIGYKNKKWESKIKKSLIDLDNLNSKMGANNYKILIYNIINNAIKRVLITLGLNEREVE